MVPDNLRFLESHEWALLEGETCTVGLSQYAVDQLTDIVHLELPKPGDSVKAKEEFGEVESVKSVNALYSPVDGEVAEVNPEAVEDASMISEDPYGKGWLIKIKVASGSTLDDLLTPQQYQEQIESED